MAWSVIKLVLARTDEFPNGSTAHGYDIVAPLSEDGHLDEAAWRADKAKSRVHRFWEGEEDEVGTLIHTRHRTWAFSYEPGEDDDEPIFKLEQHVFREGEYLPITDHEGDALPFIVANVRSL